MSFFLIELFNATQMVCDLLTMACTTGQLTEEVVNKYLKLIEHRSKDKIGVLSSFH